MSSATFKAAILTPNYGVVKATAIGNF